MESYWETPQSNPKEFAMGTSLETSQILPQGSPVFRGLMKSPVIIFWCISQPGE